MFARFHEGNIHIGDVFVVGPAGGGDGDGDGDVDGDGTAGGGGDTRLLLQVSLPRQPCFKLNHRFGLRNFAPNTWKTSRTGWYYRVLRPGLVQAGYEARLVRRPHPAWPLQRVQEYLHRQPGVMAMVAELAAIDEFGAECKNAFRSRLAKHAARERKAAQKKARAAAAAAGEQAGEARETRETRETWWRPYRVVEKRRETPRITAFVLEAVPRARGEGGGEGDEDEDEETALVAGSHVKVRLDTGAARPLVRSYSVVSGDKRRFELGVAYDEAASRGGSRFLHERVAVGGVVQAGAFSEGVPAASAASHHVFVAGGVGITAFLAQLEVLLSINYSCVLHYAVRSADEVAFAGRLRTLAPDLGASTADCDEHHKTVILYDAAKGQRMDIPAIVRGLSWNAHLSVCGPPGMMAAALAATRAAGRTGPDDVHFEAFGGADTAGGEPFDAVVFRRPDSTAAAAAAAADTPAQPRGGSPTTLHVDEDESLLDTLQEAFGIDAVASSCGAGSCGTCRVTVRSGRVVHRGTALSDEDKASGTSLLACVSRGVGRIEIEI